MFVDPKLLLGVSIVVHTVTQAHAQGPTFDILHDGRRVVQHARGLWAANSYIATVEFGQCEAVRAEIAELKAKYPMFSSESDKENLLRTNSIHKTCFVTFSGSAELFDQVKNISSVLDVDFDLLVQSTGKSPPSWGLNRIDQRNLPLSKSTPYSTCHKGRGVNIYIVDTGIYYTHDQLRNRAKVSAEADFVKEGRVYDLNGHGTHCAGTAGGKSVGVAPAATLFGVKVLNSRGSGTNSAVIQGIEWAVNNQKKHFGGKTAVISMSIGGPHSPTLEKAAKAAADANNIVVVAAGNENWKSCSFSPSGAGGNGKSGGVISVGATTSSDSRARFSNYGSCVDIFAPGQSILSSYSGKRNRYKVLSGTSMATPHVAGVAALLLEKHSFNKHAAVKELFNSAVQGLVTDSKESQNLLLQAPLICGTLPPTTASPTNAPTLQPSNAPTQYQSVFNIPNGKCWTTRKYRDAQKLCSQMGHRLCSPIELLNAGVDVDQKCRMHFKNIWTNQSCRGGMQYFNYAARKTSCLRTSRRIYVRCCPK